MLGNVQKYIFFPDDQFENYDDYYYWENEVSDTNSQRNKRDTRIKR